MTTISSTSSTTTTSSTSYTSSSSDVDWSALVEAAVQAKLTRADTIDLKITANETKIAAYQTMQTLLQNLSAAAQDLRSASGSAGQEDDVFLDRAAYLTANGSVTASDALSVTVEHGAQLGSYDIEIVSLAKSHKVASESQSARSTDLGYEGVFSLGLEGGETVEISIDEGMTLDEIVEAINAQSEATGVQASVIQVSSGQYEMLVSATETGKSISASMVSGDDVLAELGILDDGGDFADELQAAQDAVIKLDGIEITRDTNDIDDIIDGVSFHLYATTPDDTSITVDVGTNLSNVKTAIQALVESYNAYREFAYTQQGVTSAGGAADDAVLFGDGTVRSVNSAINAALNLMVDEASLATLGLSFDETNNLVLDEDTLNTALLNDLDSVKSLLSFEMSSSSSDFLLLARGSSAPSSFSIDIAVDSSGAMTSASIGGDSSMFTVSGTRIIGKSGTPYEGFTFVYAGTTSQTVDVTLSTGIAELLYNAAENAGNSTSGTLTTIIEGLEDQSDSWQSQSDTIRSRAETYRTTLTERYARYQAAIEEAESTKTYLEALLAAQSD
jgi:flagellar hook-associated protein 2